MNSFEMKVKEALQEAGRRMDEIEKAIRENPDTAQLGQKLAAMGEQVRKLYRLQISGDMAPASGGKSFWPNEEMAKEFGGAVLKVAKGLGEGSGTDGGYMVPDGLRAVLIDHLGRYGKFRANATVFPMGEAKVSVPKLAADLTIYCPGESTDTTESKPTFGQVTMSAKSWHAFAGVSRELDEDSLIAVAEIIGKSATRSIAKQEDRVGFIGDGTETYFGMRGIVGALRAVNATIGSIAGLKVASGNQYSEITLGDFRGVVALLPEEFEETAKWYMSKKFFYSVCWPLAETAGVANIFEILSPNKSKNLLGYPVEFVPCMPSTEANSQICAILGDLNFGAYLGERRQITIEQSRDVLFQKYMNAFMATERIDVNAFGVGDSTNPGPIVGLITAAA